MDDKQHRGLYVTAGVCAILWPLSELVFFAATSALARAAPLPTVERAGAYALRLAALGQRPGMLALEWGRVAAHLLLWPFLLGLYRLLAGRGQRNLALVAVGLGLTGMVVTLISQTINPSLSHALGQRYISSNTDAERSAFLVALEASMLWHRGLNQTGCLLYQGSVGLLGLAMIRSGSWRVRGWIGLIGAIVAIPAKVPTGLWVPTNFVWTGLAYCLWPIATGIGLLRERHAQ